MHKNLWLIMGLAGSLGTGMTGVAAERMSVGVNVAPTSSASVGVMSLAKSYAKCKGEPVKVGGKKVICGINCHCDGACAAACGNKA